MCGTHTQMRDERSGLLPDNPLVDGSDAWTWCIGVYDRRTPYVGMCGTHTREEILSGQWIWRTPC